mgnify:CR=1 FL=1
MILFAFFLACLFPHTMQVSPGKCGYPLEDSQPSLSWCPLHRSLGPTWCTVSQGPGTRNRYGHTLVSVDDFVIMFGGSVDGSGCERFGDDVIYILDAQLPRLAWLNIGVHEQVRCLFVCNTL